MNYYYHHIGDFKKDTNFLTHQQRSIYLELLWLYYDQEKPLPKNIDLLALKVEATKEEVQLILNVFFVQEEDCFRHRRIEEELNKMYDKSEKCRNAVLKRWYKGSNTDVIAPNTQDPIPNTQNPVYNANAWKEDKKFVEFWKAYDNKVGVDESYKVWKKNKCAQDLDLILKHIEYYKTTKQYKDGFVKNPRTYLNQKMYLDPIESVSTLSKFKGRIS